MDIYPWRDDQEKNSSHSSRVILFVHGGAWQSGNKMQYYHLAEELRDALRSTVAVMNYTLYPSGHIEHQVRDVEKAIGFIRERYPESRLVLIGHSAGAHLLSYCLSRKFFVGHSSTSWNLSDIHGWIGLSGVYDILDHYPVECRRGVERWSGMERAMHGVSHFYLHSPTQYFLYNNITPSRLLMKEKQPFVRTLLLHGGNDTTVPVSQSDKFYEALNQYFSSTRSVTLLERRLIPRVNHSDMVLALMKVKSRSRYKELVLRYIEEGIISFDNHHDGCS